MSYRHDEIDETDRAEDAEFEGPHAREVTLGTSTILGIFFVLVLLAGGFFAFGYSMGSRSHQAPTSDPSTTGDNTVASSAFDHFKPSPGAPAIQPVPGYLSQKDADAANRNAANTGYNPSGASAGIVPVAPSGNPRATASAPAAAYPPPPVNSPPAPPAAEPVHPAPRPAVADAAVGLFNVQIAAVSHQEDADLLVNALKRKGYTVAERTEPQDKLVHIQVGPFATKKDAEAMRQRLLGDGYNAILK